MDLIRHNINKEKLSVFVKFVYNLATLSKCDDKKVAAIIISRDTTQVYSIGINGGPKGGKNCLCSTDAKYSCIHAEANALVKCVSSDTDKVMICSLSPCVTCAALIVNSGFSAVYYLNEWKNIDGLDLLREAGITVEQIS